MSKTCNETCVTVIGVVALVNTIVLVSNIGFTFRDQDTIGLPTIININTTNATHVQNTVSLPQYEPLNPSNWEELNEQQFCRIENKQKHSQFFQHIYNNQFGKNCSDPSTKFLIFDIALQTSQGLGASIWGNMIRYFTTALMLNRTFLLHGIFDWSYLVPYCKGRNAMQCYFLPLSNCDPKDLFRNIDKKDPNIYIQGKGPSDCIFGDNDPYHNLSHCPQKVIYINHKNRKRPVMMKAIRNYCKTTYNLDYTNYCTIISSFLLRPQPAVKDIVLDKIKKSVYKSLNGKLFRLDAARTISLPIRGSDKCKNIHKVTGLQYVHKPEIRCFTPDEYIGVMNAIDYVTDSSMDTVIITSEDASFVKLVVDKLRNKTRSKVWDWNVIINTEDYSVGEGTTTYRQTQLMYDNNVDKEVGTSLYTDHVVSAISSIMLQVHLDTKYFVLQGGSSWTRLMWKWASELNCNLYDRDKHIAGRSRCISLSVPGYTAIHQHEKYVVWDRETCKILSERNVSRDSFYNEYRILVGAKEWTDFCQETCS